MKKTFILTIIGLLAVLPDAGAQFYVGGSFHVSTRLADERGTSFSISPDIGYSVGNWCLGSSIEWFSTGEGDGPGLTVNPYAEYFFWSSGPLSFFVEGGIGLTWCGGFSCTPYLAPGISFNISDRWSVMGHIGRLGYDSLEKTLEFSTSAASALALGLYYSF